jgi:hypothetical protein
VLVSGLEPDDMAILTPKHPAIVEGLGIRGAADGTAWIVALPASEYRLIHDGGYHYAHGAAC